MVATERLPTLVLLGIIALILMHILSALRRLEKPAPTLLPAVRAGSGKRYDSALVVPIAGVAILGAIFVISRLIPIH